MSASASASASELDLIRGLIELLTTHLKNQKKPKPNLDKGLSDLKRELDSLMNKGHPIYFNDLSLKKQQELEEIYEISMNNSEVVGQFTLFD